MLGAALALPGVFAAPASAEPPDVNGGYADWGVRESFRNYIENLAPDGEIKLSGGTTRNGDGTFRFPVRGGHADLATGHVDVRLRGSVSFSAHDGVLDITIADPRVVIDAGEATVYAELTSGSEAHPGIGLANLSPGGVEPLISEDAIEWDAVPATFTEEAAEVFGPQYVADPAMDPLSLVAQLGPAPKAPRVRVREQARLAKGRKATVAQMRCATGPCAVVAPKRAKVRVGKQLFNAKVQAPLEIPGGKRAPVTVKVAKRVARKLAGRAGRVRFQVRVRAGAGAQAKQSVNTKLIGRKTR